MKLNKKPLVVFGVLIIIQILTALNIAEAFSHSVEFVVDFSENMNEMIGDRSKIEIAREVVSKVLDKIDHSLKTELILYGHRENDKCDDIELMASDEKLDREAIKKKLMETQPKGKASIALSLKAAAERINDAGDYKSIVLVTDGKTTCEGDFVKMAREVKERYDFRVTFHVIGLNPDNNNRRQLFRVANSGYGIYTNLRNEKDVETVVKATVERINRQQLHSPKEVNLDQMVLIPAGEFFMGSAFPEDDPNEHPRHSVHLDAFYIDKYEVTQRQFKTVMGYNPSIWIGSDLPADSVSWFEAKQFCEKAGKRLPTEAEWEKAAKGGRDDIWPGTNTKENIGEYAWIDDEIVDINDRSGSRAHPVGQKKPNGYGIYDMAGNVWEWVQDWHGVDYYKYSPGVNPKGPEKGNIRVLRGGCWDSHWIEVRTANRYGKPPETKYANNGFRCAKSAE